MWIAKKKLKNLELKEEFKGRELSSKEKETKQIAKQIDKSCGKCKNYS